MIQKIRRFLGLEKHEDGMVDEEEVKNLKKEINHEDKENG